MDPRLEHRRRHVAEEKARSNLGRLVRLLALVALLAVVVWFVQSPFLSVGEIEVIGASRVDVPAVLAEHEVVTGRPMVLLDVAGAEADLLEDPWVAAAEVARDWPTTVVVTVDERTPAVSALLETGWWLVAADGTLLTETDAAMDGMGVARFEDMSPDREDDFLDLGGAVEFLVALAEPYRSEAVVTAGTDGLEATVAGFLVRLGRPFDMTEKAAVTTAILDDGVPEGSIITVVAPASPAVLPPNGGAGATPTTQPEA